MLVFHPSGGPDLAMAKSFFMATKEIYGADVLLVVHRVRGGGCIKLDNRHRSDIFVMARMSPLLRDQKTYHF